MIARLKEWSRHEYFWISVLSLAVLAMHFAIILYPNNIVLDEVYYVNDVRGFLNGGILIRAEHPPLAETFIKLGMMLFGDNSFGEQTLLTHNTPPVLSSPEYLSYLTGKREFGHRLSV